ncbi:MAG TPA: 3-phosphoserine/phosphohydroxythreonine transaminase [Burkholderiales bacterium]|jgi:phosphoserine aminotransferase|nr:3-phosphoserine/phosphohydroxythreonine transaminase [Burkholderiales bacterium]
MSRIFNFSAGPAMLPAEVLSRAGDEMLDWHGTGMSVMEMSHRGKEFIKIAEEAEFDLRELLDIPVNYEVLFLQGGATLQFAQVPMNLLHGKGKADYVVTGEWSKKAVKEAKKYCDVAIAASSEDKNFTYAPKNWTVRKDAAYVHYCSNETIGGVEFHETPNVEIPLVADASSHFLSRPLDVGRFGLVYAGAQKNVGPAGLTIVIVRGDLLGRAEKGTPSVMDYKLQAEADSMLNTPATYSMYVAGLVFKWVKQQGGIPVIEKRNIEKARLLYDFLDSSSFFRNPVAREDRSRMNVPFTLKDAKLDDEFLKGAAKEGMVQLKGHRSVGGMRASIYNAMPIEGVRQLVEYMKNFEKKHG